MLTHEEIEAKKQLFGIKVILIIDTILFSIIFIIGVGASFDNAYNYGAVSGVFLFLANLIVYGGLTYMASMGLVGLNNRKNYSIPICRAALILTGLVPILFFWSRLKNPLVKRYLNYGFEVIKEELTNNSTGKTETQLKIESFKGSALDKNYKKIFNICFYSVIGWVTFIIFLSFFIYLNWADFLGTILGIFINFWIWLFMIFISIFRKNHKAWALVVSIIFGFSTIMATMYPFITF